MVPNALLCLHAGNAKIQYLLPCGESARGACLLREDTILSSGQFSG